MQKERFQPSFPRRSGDHTRRSLARCARDGMRAREAPGRRPPKHKEIATSVRCRGGYRRGRSPRRCHRRSSLRTRYEDKAPDWYACAKGRPKSSPLQVRTRCTDALAKRIPGRRTCPRSRKRVQHPTHEKKKKKKKKRKKRHTKEQANNS